jgi:lipoyl(octanoyl) transferase
VVGGGSGWYREAVVIIGRRPGDHRAGPTSPGSWSLHARWLGHVPYRVAWDLQHRLAAARALDLVGDHLLLLQHPPVITLGRHGDAAHVLAPPEVLAAQGIEVVRVERGGEATYHGPGQLVAYPIVHLAQRGILLRPFVRALEAAMAETCAALGVTAGRRDGAPGCWCDPLGPLPRKIGALGVRVERGVSYHGIALNVTTDLTGFSLINPCGMPGVMVTSVARERGWPSAPDLESVHRAAIPFAQSLARLLGADLVGNVEDADPARELADLEGLLARVEHAGRPPAPDGRGPGGEETVAVAGAGPVGRGEAP